MKIFELRTEDEIGEPEEEVTTSFFKSKDNDGYIQAVARTKMYDKLEDLGWEQIGTGHFSFVFANPKKNYVLKITDTPDPGYAEYVNLIKSHKNKYFPHISDMKILEVSGQKYGVYLIEKLGRLERSLLPYADIIDKLVTGLSVDRVYKIYEDDPAKVNEIVKNQELMKAIKLLRYWSKKKGFSIDIHDANVMQRTDGTIVVTDPYSFFRTSKVGKYTRGDRPTVDKQMTLGLNRQ